MAGEGLCWWMLAHRDMHHCGCVCILTKGHAGKHQCSAAAPAPEAT